MAEISAVKDPTPDPKTGKTRPKSEIAFPYFDLQKSIEAVRVIHDRAGGRCSRAQLAPLLGYSAVKNGGFLSRISAAKMFGLMEEFGDSLVLSERAKSIISSVHPTDVDKAKVDAFLDVELHRRVFEHFNGQSLPGEDGLKNLLENQYKVVPKRVAYALKTMLDSADTAGFFLTTGNRSKMVRPIISNETHPVIEAKTQEDKKNKNTAHDEDVNKKKVSGSGSNGGDGGDAIAAAFDGAIKNLPPLGTKIGPKRRIALAAAFSAIINLLYPEEEDEA